MTRVRVSGSKRTGGELKFTGAEIVLRVDEYQIADGRLVVAASAADHHVICPEACTVRMPSSAHALVHLEVYFVVVVVVKNVKNKGSEFQISFSYLHFSQAVGFVQDEHVSAQSDCYVGCLVEPLAAVDIHRRVVAAAAARVAEARPLDNIGVVLHVLQLFDADVQRLFTRRRLIQPKHCGENLARIDASV